MSGDASTRVEGVALSATLGRPRSPVPTQADAMARLHRSLVAQAVAVKKVEKQSAAVALRERVGDALDAILDAYVEQLATHCVEAEVRGRRPLPRRASRLSEGPSTRVEAIRRRNCAPRRAPRPAGG